MKTKNQTEHHLLELALNSAANEDGISQSGSRDGVAVELKQAWSPLEVWRTRVKAPTPLTRTETAPG